MTFLIFTAHMLPATVLSGLAAFALVRLMFGKLEEEDEEGFVHGHHHLRDLRHEITIWLRTARSMGEVTREESLVKAAVFTKIEELKNELEEREMMLGDVSAHASKTRSSAVADLASSCRIRNRVLLAKSLLVLVVTIVLFFLSNFPEFNLSLGWTALLGALTLLLLADKAEMESVLARVEWATLIFFATLFVVMEALTKLGLLR